MESASILSRQVRTVFPDLEKTTFTHTWTGKLGITFDLMPHIGEVNGIHYTFGYGGHGLSIATYLGTEIGLLLSGQKKRSPFEEISHQTMFFIEKIHGFCLLQQNITSFWIGFLSGCTLLK